MTQYTDVEYLKLSRWSKFTYKFLLFLYAIPRWFVGVGKGIWHAIKRFGLWVASEAVDIFMTFKNGDWKTRVSFLIMGFGSVARKQWIRGILFFAMEVVFILYMVLQGGNWLSQFGTLGTLPRQQNKYGVITNPGDNSFNILLYCLLTIVFICAFIWTWRFNVKQNKIAQQILESGRPLRSGKEDLRSLLDDQFHKTMLALPLAGILIFTVLPIIFMILVAFTNYGIGHDPASGQLFTWVGMDNFNQLFNIGDSASPNFSIAFRSILLWTLIWAFFATFLNYVLGTFVALMINKKGLKFKKLWRGILVLTIAIPQFISLLYVSKMFSDSGYVIAAMKAMHMVDNTFTFWNNTTWARVMVIIINVWIGIPYLMLMVTGVLMNVPADLYESAKIDGASGVKQFTKITLPYLLFVTGPYLLTSFTGNINNFNVIFLLTGGAPKNKDFVITLGGATVQAGDTDLLITWLYSITTGAADGAMYNLAAVLSIMIFIVVAGISIIVYSILPSNRSEEDYA